MRTMDGLRLSALRLLFSWRMILVRKPDTTFRDHAFAGGESFRGVVVKQNSGAKARRENDFCCLQNDIQGGFIVSIWKAFRP